MSTHYIYEGKEYATLAEVRRAVNKSFPKNPDTAMLLCSTLKLLSARIRCRRNQPKKRRRPLRLSRPNRKELLPLKK